MFRDLFGSAVNNHEILMFKSLTARFYPATYIPPPLYIAIQSTTVSSVKLRLEIQQRIARAAGAQEQDAEGQRFRTAGPENRVGNGRGEVS